ncbi:MAG: ketol-acid reductoisomerase [Candidatus Eisenbacteria bacterium]|nr:ketol-acid reductoisomerase [Candidatus Eisenbacteria bacterium]
MPHPETRSVVTERDLNEEPLDGRRVGVIGYGSQGEAQALNLRDSGVDVVVGLREGSPSADRARTAGLDVTSVRGAAGSDIVALLIPDEEIVHAFAESVEPVVEEGSTLVLAHGFALRFGGLEIAGGIDVVLVAPMGPGTLLRERYQAGTGLPAAYAVDRDATGRARQTALEYGAAIGCARVGLFETGVAEETEVDLFAEQAVLVGGVIRLIEAAFETLVEAGYDPAVAYMECLYELGLTADLMQRFGVSGMRNRISRTALFGDLTRGGRIIGEETRNGMRQVLEEIRNGRFAEELAADVSSEGRETKQALERARQSLLLRVEEAVAPVVHPGRDEHEPDE